MVAERNLILDKKQTLKKIKRIAYEIYEQNYKAKEIVIAGIYDRGYSFGKLLQKELSQISELKTTLIKVTVDKTGPLQSGITLDVEPASLKNKIVIITDDVLNTGRTLAYSLKPFLNIQVAKIQTAVMIDRNHRTYPLAADFVGYSLATTLKEHVEVSFGKDDFGVYVH